MPRPDARLPNQLRPFAAEPGVLSRADGSASFSLESTEALVAVYGPGEVRRARERTDTATIEVHVRPRGGLPGPVERELEQLLLSTLEHAVLGALHPRTSITVVVQTMRDDGSFAAAAINAVGLALLHAGVPMRGMLAACAVALLPTGEAVLDPTAAEQEEAAAGGGVLTAGYLLRQRGEGNVERQLLLSHVTGALGAGHFDMCLHASQQAAVCVGAFCRQVTRRRRGRGRGRGPGSSPGSDAGPAPSAGR